MKRFTNKYTQKITGTIECFDRLLFKGHLPISWSGSMENFMSNQGLLIKDFGKFVSHHSEHVKVHAKDMAEKTGRPYIHLGGPVRKEKMAKVATPISLREIDFVLSGILLLPALCMLR